MVLNLANAYGAPMPEQQLPEASRADQLEAAARQGAASGPPGTGVGLAQPPAPPQAAAPQPQQPAGPAVPVPAQGGQEPPQQGDPLIYYDFKKRPMASLALMLANFADGLAGRESTTTERRANFAEKKRDADLADDARRYAMSLQRAQMGKTLFETAYEIGRNNSPEAAMDYLNVAGGNFEGAETIRQGVTTALASDDTKMRARLDVVQQMNDPEMVNIAGSLLASGDTVGFEKFTDGILEGFRRVKEAGATTTATKTAELRVEERFAPETAMRTAREAFARVFGEKSAEAQFKDVDPKEARAQGNNLRGEFIQGSKNFIVIRDAYQRVKQSAGRKTAASDRALIYAFMKMQDPTSAILPGEYATAENARGVSDAARSVWNNLLSGTLLSDTQRADFLGQAKASYEGASKNHKSYVKEYTRLAKDTGSDVKQVIVDYFDEDIEAANAAGQTDYDKNGNPSSK